MKSFLLCLCALLLLTSFSFGQAIGEYRSNVATGNWNVAGSWQTFNGAIWVAAGAAPTGNEPLITIQGGHNITIPTAGNLEFTITTQLDILATGTLTIATAALPPRTKLTLSGTGLINNFGTISITGGGTAQVGASIFGTLVNGGTISNSLPEKLIFNTNSIYEHTFTVAAGAVPTATWTLSSTCRITSTNDLTPTGLGQAFGNFEWDYPTQTAFIDLGGTLTTVNGNLNLVTNQFAGVTLNGSGSNYALNIAGSFNCNEYFELNSGSGTATVNVTGNMTVDDPNNSGSYLVLNSGIGQTNLNITGDLLIDNVAGFASLDMSYAGSGSSTINLRGDYTTQNGGTLVAGGGSGNYQLNFIGTALQTVTETQAINGINISIPNSSSIVSIPDNSFLGTNGTFLLGAGATLMVGSTSLSGAIQTGTTDGSIRVSGTRTYGVGSKLVYNGVAAQQIGNGFPTTDVDLEINNASGVTNNNGGTTNVIGDLTLTSGSLNIGAGNTLDIRSNFIVTGGTIGGTPSSNLIFSNFGSLGTLVFTTGAQELNNLTVDRVATLVLNSNLTVAGVINLSAGSLDFSGNTLTVTGSSITSGGGTGLISSSTLSNLIFGGGSFSGSVPFLGSNQLNNLTFSTNSGLYTWASNVTVNGNLTLSSGALTHTSGLTMGTNSTIFKGAGAISGASPGAVTSYNVTYTGIGNTGVELPISTTALNNLTVASSGAVNLITTGVTINGNALFSSGNFVAGSNTLFMNGPTWATSGGTFTAGTGTVEITGTTSILGTTIPRFYNLTIADGANCTARPGVIDIESNLQIDANSTFNHNNGTFNFVGGALQVIGAGGNSLYDITVNKTGDDLQLTSQLNLINSLRVISPTTVESNGNLVLISTSDGPTGNARIGQLTGGANIIGDVTAQRFMSDEGRIYRYISSPITNASVAQLQGAFPITGIFSGASTGCTGCTANPSMYYYDETVAGTLQDGYFQFPVSSNGETLQPGRGYVPFVRDDIIPGNVTISVTGPINQGTVIFPVTFNGSGDGAANGYNLVGNPYPSPIDWDNASGWTKTNIATSIAVRDNGGGGVFHYWDGDDGTFNNGQIAIGQGFWVRATGSPTLTANEAAKTPAGGTFYRTSEEKEELHSLEFLLTDGTLTDHAYLRLRTQATNLLDEFDAPKLDNGSFDMYTVSEDNLPMAINAMKTVGCDQPIKLGIKDMPNGSFSISRNAKGAFEQYNVALLDKFTNTTVVLGAEDKHDFTITDDPLSKAEDRFTITLSISEPADVEYTDEVLYSNYSSGNQWYRNGVAIEGATEPSYTPDLSGEYSLIVTVGTCQSVAARTFQITGVEEEDLSRVRIFPNPAVDVVQVEVRSSSPVSVELLDVMGRSMESIGVSEVSAGLWVGSTNMSSFKKGVYIVRVYDSVNGLYHRRIIKE